MLSTIIGCALASVVLAVGVLALLTYTKIQLAELRMRCERLENDLKGTTGAHLQVELAALAADVAALSKTVKKNFGRVWAEMHQDGTLERNKRAQQDAVDDAPYDRRGDVDQELDPAFEAALALQHAHSARAINGS